MMITRLGREQPRRAMVPGRPSARADDEAAPQAAGDPVEPALPAMRSLAALLRSTNSRCGTADSGAGRAHRRPYTVHQANAGSSACPHQLWERRKSYMGRIRNKV
jgi:hypothetical protein